MNSSRSKSGGRMAEVDEEVDDEIYGDGGIGEGEDEEGATTSRASEEYER